MQNNLIQESIKKGKIQLNLLETLLHCRVSVILLIVAIFSFTNGLKTISFTNLNSVNIILGFAFIILSLISFLYQQNRLKLICIKTNQDNSVVIENITELARQKNWNLELENNALIIKTTRLATSKIFISQSGGEKVYVFFKPDKTLLLRSIFDFKKSYGFVVSSGENNENEKYILQRIKPAANTC